jgi:hypothetical protein
MKTPKLRKSIGRPPSRLGLPRVQRIWIIRGFLLIPLVLVYFALSPIAQAKPHPTPTPTPAPTATPTPTPTPSPTPAGEDLGGGNTAAENVEALVSLTTGVYNTATGWQSLYSNTEGTGNTATGYAALYSNTTGNSNTATGVTALYSNTTGFANTANGINALSSNTTGFANTANGVNALLNNTEGSNNTALGTLAGNDVTTANNVIAIGATGANVSNSCFIGNIWGTITVDPAPVAVVIGSNGQLGTQASSQRFKNDIRRMEQASEAILGLKPVTFHYKSDSTGTPQFGLIAEEVAQVNPDLVVRNADGEIYTVRYDAVNAMLLNEFLKEHRRVEKLEAALRAVNGRLAEHDAKIQRVSAELATASSSHGGLEVSKFATGRIRGGGPAPQTAVNNQ